jgi:hypothetical protein
LVTLTARVKMPTFWVNYFYSKIVEFDSKKNEFAEDVRAAVWFGLEKKLDRMLQMNRNANERFLTQLKKLDCGCDGEDRLVSQNWSRDARRSWRDEPNQTTNSRRSQRSE